MFLPYVCNLLFCFPANKFEIGVIFYQYLFSSLLFNKMTCGIMKPDSYYVKIVFSVS